MRNPGLHSPGSKLHILRLNRKPYTPPSPSPTKMLLHESNVCNSIFAQERVAAAQDLFLEEACRTCECHHRTPLLRRHGVDRRGRAQAAIEYWMARKGAWLEARFRQREHSKAGPLRLHGNSRTPVCFRAARTGSTSSATAGSLAVGKRHIDQLLLLNITSRRMKQPGCVFSRPASRLDPDGPPEVASVAAVF